MEDSDPKHLDVVLLWIVAMMIGSTFSVLLYLRRASDLASYAMIPLVGTVAALWLVRRYAGSRSVAAIGIWAGWFVVLNVFGCAVAMAPGSRIALLDEAPLTFFHNIMISVAGATTGCALALFLMSPTDQTPRV